MRDGFEENRSGVSRSGPAEMLSLRCSASCASDLGERAELSSTASHDIGSDERDARRALDLLRVAETGLPCDLPLGVQFHQ